MTPLQLSSPPAFSAGASIFVIGPTPWKKAGFSSAALQPLPFCVSTWMSLAALALLRQHVDEQRLVVMAREAENLLHLGYVVAVEGAPVAYVELFENVRRQQQRLQLLLYLRKRLMDALAVPASRALVFYIVLEFFVCRYFT